ncbi:MAG: InlB B-repeat-containing protein [Methanocorpusculum sp.]|nr:InlB B-repeat-containing protein [Methanocorpusculum sp.]
MKNEKCLKTTSKKALHRFAALAAVLLAVCLVFMMPVSAADSVFSGGSGTENDPYKISTADDLKQLATDVNSGNTYSEKYFQLTQDITLSGEWTPIGKDNLNAFMGTFDGNVKTISGLSIENTNLMFVGLFGYSSGIIKDLHVDGEIKASHSTYLVAGGISGVNAGTIQNCHSSVSVTATISGSNAQSVVMAGGIAGSHLSGIIQNCYSTGNVKATGGAMVVAGGIVGMDVNGDKITSCYATGAVNAEGTVVSVGGIVGLRGSNPGGDTGGCTLEYCYALNEKVSATGTTTYVGRVTGNLGNGNNVKNNYGLKHMTVGTTTVNGGTATDKDGAPVCAGAIQSAGWDSNTWDMFGNGQYILPVLKDFSGNPTATPTHIETVTVTFEANSGTPVLESQTILEGAKVTKPTDLTNTNYGEGYTFGWYKDVNGDDAWNFETDSFCKDDQSTTLYAQWTPITYTVKFNANANDAAGSMDDQEFKYGETEPLTANTFTKEGHSFAGWATSPDGAVVYTDGVDGSELTTTETLVNLYAKWMPDIYTVKFNANANDAAGSMDYQTFTYGVSQKLNKSGFTRTGYNFNGWMLESNGVLEHGDEATVLNLPYNEDSKEITLYANWTSVSSTAPTTHTVTFKDGENVVSEQLVSDGEKVQQQPTLTKTGYTLSGWNKEDGTEWNFASEKVIDDITLTANWTGNPYTVKFNENGGTGSMADQSFTYGTSQALTANTFSKTGYSFEGWSETEGGNVKYSDGDSVSNLAESGTVNLYAVWKINKYTINFDTQGGSTINPITQDYGTDIEKPANPTKTGYTFKGWDKSIPTTMPAENTALTAKWEINTYHVSFNSNGGSGKYIPSQKFEYGASQALTANTFTAPAGMVFNGWNTKADGSGTAYADKATVKNLALKDGSIITLYAQWKSVSSGSESHSTTKTTYTVTFNANGGAGEMFQQTFTSGKEKALNLNFFTREGYTFAGWATSADGDVVYTDGETIKVSKSMTLYAVWESNEPVNPEQPGDEPGQPGDEPENPEKPTEPETPAPILAVLAGLGAAVVLRRK